MESVWLTPPAFRPKVMGLWMSSGEGRLTRSQTPSVYIATGLSATRRMPRCAGGEPTAHPPRQWEVVTDPDEALGAAEVHVVRCASKWRETMLKGVLRTADDDGMSGRERSRALSIESDGGDVSARR